MAEVYFSTGVFQSRSITEIVDQCLHHRVDHIELSSGIEYQSNLLDPVWATTGSSIKYMIHNYFPPPEKAFVLNLASSDYEILRKSIDFCRNAIDLAVKLEAPFYSVHSGFALNLTPELLGSPSAQSLIPATQYIPYETAYTTFAESIALLTKYAASKGIKLLIENNVVSPYYLKQQGKNGLLMTFADEIVRFMRDLNDPWLGLLVDTGHVNVTATALGFSRKQFIEAVAPYVCAFHISSNDGITDQNLPFDESDWFSPIMGAFSRLPFVIEAYKLTFEQMSAQRQLLNKLLS